MARLGGAIKCYSFQSWPLEPILRDPLCIMKMVHMMIKKDLIHFKSFVFFDVFTSYSRAGESVSAWQRRWEPSKGPESRSRTVYAKLESNSEPERARVCQRVAVRASESQSGSHRESQRAIESQREPGREPQREPIRARRNLNIVLLQNN